MYYAHREKLRLIGRENDLEKINRNALRLAREVADKTGTMMAGNPSYSTVYRSSDSKVQKEIYEMAVEQVQWAVEEGADYIVAETYESLGEAMIALKAIMEHGNGLVERLADGETVVVAEGYLFEFEARGYLKAGAFVPEVILDHPELVRQLHQEFVHAGSDVVLAFTYYTHREKLRLIGREDELERINRTALRLAREVADETGTLMAGNLSNSTVYKLDDPKVHQEIYAMAVEQVKWAVEEGADYIVAETFDNLGEAMIALKAIKEHGNGLPAVVTYSILPNGRTLDGLVPGDACSALEKAGAAVVGLNCGRGPATMMPILKEVRKACKGPVAALPVVYRTDEKQPTFQSLTDINNPDSTAFPIELPAYLCSQKQVYNFSKEAKDLGVQYLGLCCGNRSHYLRTMAEAVGRSPPASRFSADMSQHYSRMMGERHEETQQVFSKLYKMQ